VPLVLDAVECPLVPASAELGGGLLQPEAADSLGLDGWSTLIDRSMNFSSGARLVMSRRSAAKACNASSVSSPATPPPAISTLGRPGL